jgi:hypothetical protein
MPLIPTPLRALSDHPNAVGSVKGQKATFRYSNIVNLRVVGQLRSTNQKQVSFFLIPICRRAAARHLPGRGGVKQEGNDCALLCDVGVLPLANQK